MENILFLKIWIHILERKKFRFFFRKFYSRFL